MAEQLQVGALCRLRSGGPIMTVSAVSVVDGERQATCKWFMDNGVHTDTFHEDMVEPATPRKPAGFGRSS